MTREERNAVLEEAARWHDKRRYQMTIAERQAMEFNTAVHFHALASFHEDSAAAVRALKEQEPTT